MSNDPYEFVEEQKLTIKRTLKKISNVFSQDQTFLAIYEARTVFKISDLVFRVYTEPIFETEIRTFSRKVDKK